MYLLYGTVSNTAVSISDKFYFFLKSMWMLQVSDKLLLVSKMNRSNRNVSDNSHLPNTLFFEYFFLKLKKKHPEDTLLGNT